MRWYSLERKTLALTKEKKTNKNIFNLLYKQLSMRYKKNNRNFESDLIGYNRISLVGNAKRRNKHKKGNVILTFFTFFTFFITRLLFGWV